MYCRKLKDPNSAPDILAKKYPERRATLLQGATRLAQPPALLCHPLAGSDPFSLVVCIVILSI
jgi:hypothetical protein